MHNSLSGPTEVVCCREVSSVLGVCVRGSTVYCIECTLGCNCDLLQEVFVLTIQCSGVVDGCVFTFHSSCRQSRL